jgi:1-acyl-sn-glycerol-3-phosphate acyltransferase
VAQGSLRVVVRSIGIWTYVALSVFVAFMPVLVLYVVWAPFDRRRRPILWLMRAWARTVMRLNPMWHVRAEGLEHIDPRQCYVITPNHQSQGDILVLGLVDLPYVYIAKRELFSIPFLGWGMWMAGCISVRRGDKDSHREALSRAAVALRRGVSLLIFPEGTRSRDGNVGAFKDGAFRLALKTGRPILPVAIEGSRFALPKGSWLFTENADIRLAVLPPISVEGKDESHVEDLRESARDLIERKVLELRARGRA